MTVRRPRPDRAREPSPRTGPIAALLLAAGLCAVTTPGAARVAALRPHEAPAVSQERSCSASPVEALVKLTPAEVLQQPVLTTSMLSEHAANTVLINRPDAPGLSDLRFRILLTPSALGALDGADLDGVHELQVLNTQQADSDTAKRLGVTNAGGWNQLTFEGPASSPLWPLQMTRNRVLAVYACAADDRLVASGAIPVKVRSFRLALLLSILLIVAIYLTAVTVVWRVRNKAAHRPRKVQSPQRWHPVRKVAWVRCLDPVVLCADAFDRGALAKLQILGFTLLVVFGVSLVALCTGVLSDVSPSVAYLLGLPALGSLGAGLTTLTRDRLSSENWAWLVSRGVLPVNDRSGELPRWRDIFTSDDELDLYKIQAAAFSLVVALGLLQTGIFSLGTFTVPSTILQILGLSQLVFVGGRLTKPATIGDLDKLITELKSREAALKQAAATGRDTDLSGKPLTQVSASPGPYANLAAALAVTAIPNAVRRYQETADEIIVILESVAHAPVKHAALAPHFP